MPCPHAHRPHAHRPQGEPPTCPEVIGQQAGGRLYRWGPVLLVLLVLGSAVATYRFDLGERWFGIERADPVENPAAVAPPEGLDLPEALPAPAVAVAARARSCARSGQGTARPRPSPDRSRPRQACRGRRRPAGRWTAGLPVRQRGGDPGIDPETGDRHRSPRRSRAGSDVRDHGGGRTDGPRHRPGRWGRPLPVEQATQGQGPGRDLSGDACRRGDPGAPDRQGARGIGRGPRPPGVRRLAVLRSGR